MLTLNETHERAMTALARLPTTSGKGYPPSVRTTAVFGHAPYGHSFPLNRKTAENNVETIPLDGLEPRQEFMPVAGLKSYIVRSRRDPPDVVRLRTRDGRERLIVQEGHTRLAAAVLRGDTSMPVRVWEFVESPLGRPEPVPRGRHEIGDRQRRRVAEPYRNKMQRLADEWGFRFDLIGNENSGNYGHEGRPGEVGGSAPKGGGSASSGKGESASSGEGEAKAEGGREFAHHRSPFGETATGHKHNDPSVDPHDDPALVKLKDEWALVNRQLKKHMASPESPEYKKLMDQQKSLVKEMHKLNLDNGDFVDGVGLPGGPRDVIIIGAGPAGMSAAINGGTEGLDTLFIDANPYVGGQMAHTSRVENDPGFPAGISGKDLSQRYLDQAERVGAEGKLGVKVTSISHDAATGLKTVTLSNGEVHQARSVILGIGLQASTPRDPNDRSKPMPNSDAPGVSVLDNVALERASKGGIALIIGGANSAAQAAIGAVDSGAKEAIILARTGTGNMSETVKSTVKAYEKPLEGFGTIKTITGDEIEKIHTDADGRATGVTLKSGRMIQADGIGFFIGSKPVTGWLAKTPGIKLTPEKNEKGEPNKNAGLIQTNENFETDIPGVFAIGDTRAASTEHDSIGRIGAAQGEGVVAIRNVFKYFQRDKHERAKKARATATAKAEQAEAAAKLEAQPTVGA